MFFFSVSYSPL